MKTTLLSGLPLAFALAACGDTTASKSSGDAGADGAVTAPHDASSPGDDTGPNPAPDAGARSDAGPNPAGEAAFVQIELAPRQTLYTRADHPTVTVALFDRYGDPIADADWHRLAWSVVPAGQATLDLTGDTPTLTFALEGPGAVRACATADVCGRSTFFVDDAPPALVLDHPQPGEALSGDPVVTVSGSVTGDNARVFVNDQPVELGADGRFTTDLPAVFGLNRVEVTADDGVQPTVREIRECLWARRYLPAQADGFDTGASLALRLGQTLLDRGDPPPMAGDDGVIHATDVAGLLEAAIEHIDPTSLLGNPVLAQGDPLDLTITALRLAEPDVTLNLTDTGLDVLLRVARLEVDTEGQLALEGESVNLNGTVRAQVAGYVRVGLVAGADGSPALTLESSNVAVEALSGQMGDSTAQAVLDTFGSLLRGTLEAYARRAVDDLIRTRVPHFIELGLGDALAPLADIPLDVSGDPILPEIHLRAGFALDAPTLVAGSSLTLALDGHVTQPAPVVAPHADPGLADDERADGAPPWPAVSDAAVAVRLRAVNALLHELWRQGALHIDVSAALPDNLKALVNGVQLDANLPPLVVGTEPGAPALFELQLGEVTLVAQGARNPAPDEYTLSVRVGLTLVAEEGHLHFDLAESPDVRVALRHAGGERPFLPADTLGELVSNLAWTKLREAVGNGLDLRLDEIHLAPPTLGALSTQISDIHVVPLFPVAPRVRDGWFVLPASMDVRLQ